MALPLIFSKVGIHPAPHDIIPPFDGQIVPELPFWVPLFEVFQIFPGC